MEFRKVLALRGPNVWANFPVLEAWVDLGELKDSPSDEIPGFNDRLMAWLPTMIEHNCSVGERGGFFVRLRRGTYQAHILEHVTLELQELAGVPVGFGRARETAEDGVYKVVVECEEETLARECLAAARELCLAAVYDRPFDVPGTVDRLRKVAQRHCLGPSTGAIVEAARKRKIPARRLNAPSSLVMLGQGARQRRIWTAETDRTGAIAEGIAKDKELTRQLLRAVGVPVPDGRPVDSADDAWAAAQEIGTPVVVKPGDGNHGDGVATDLRTEAQVRAAYDAARAHSEYVLVETFAKGADHRLLVVGDRLVAASRREPPKVVGDGRQTIAELVAEVNRDPRRGDDHATALSKIVIDPIALAVLAEQGYSADSVPPTGTAVLVRRNSNLSTGATATDVTDLVHPEVAARALDAAKMVGLDLAGVDVVVEDIGRPLEEQGGAIVEVNAGPGLRMHVDPSVGTPRPVGEAIIATLFADGDDGRIPTIAVTGVNGKTTTTRLIAHIVGATGKTVGMTNTDGIYVGGRRIEAGDCSGPRSARMVLMNPRVEAAVLETARGGILREGLGFDRCHVAVVMNIGEGDHLGLSDIHSLEKLALVKRTIVDVLLPTGTAVLKADDPLVANMAPHSPGGVVYFARDPADPVIADHRATGGRAAFARDGLIVLAEGQAERPLIALAEIPLTHGGLIGFQVENALAAAAAAWSIGLPDDLIAAGLATYANDAAAAPGRFYVIRERGATVILDYGHNPSALAALIEATDAIPHTRRSIVFSAEGDRRDEDILRQAEILADAFDRVVLYELGDRRGREPGAITGLIRQGLAIGSRVADVVEADRDRTIATALADLAEGDLVLIQSDVVADSLGEVRRVLSGLGSPAIGSAPLSESRVDSLSQAAYVTSDALVVD